MRSILLVLLTAMPLAAQTKPISNGRVAAQIGLGTVAVPIGFAAGYIAGSGFRPHGQSNTGVALGFAGALLAPAGTVHGLGTTEPRGNFGATVGGTAIGYAALVGLFPLTRKVPNSTLKNILSVATVFLPAVGGTIAYNATRK